SKMVLPIMGGGASFWTSCVLFFQRVVRAGYLYAHLVSTRVSLRKLMIAHTVLLPLTLLLLPIRQRLRLPPSGAEPVTWLLLLLGASIGIPFFFLSTNGPLLQRWFAETGHRDAGNPYFLYSASNAGSLLALLAYPVVVEPRLALAGQRTAWSVGYAGLIALIAACAWIARRGRMSAAAPASIAQERVDDEGVEVTPALRIRWLLLAAVPSGMMLAITTFMTTDIAPIPLLWVIPLALYLLSFILVFRRNPWPRHAFWVRWEPIFLVTPAVFLFWGGDATMLAFGPFHLLAFFFVAMTCHGELVRLKPRVSGLTEFYLLMSLGGALGGVFCAIVAPFLFTSVAEYPWLIVAACALRPVPDGQRWTRGGWSEILLLATIAMLAIATAVRLAAPAPAIGEAAIEPLGGMF